MFLLINLEILLFIFGYSPLDGSFRQLFYKLIQILVKLLRLWKSSMTQILLNIYPSHCLNSLLPQILLCLLNHIFIVLIKKFYISKFVKHWTGKSALFLMLSSIKYVKNSFSVKMRLLKYCPHLWCDFWNHFMLCLRIGAQVDYVF